MLRARGESRPTKARAPWSSSTKTRVSISRSSSLGRYEITLLYSTRTLFSQGSHGSVLPLYWIVSLGTYYDLVDLVSAITTESIQYNGSTEPWEPWLKSVRVLYNSVISYLPREEDREILTRVFVDEDQGARALVGRLSPRARSIYDALQDKDTDRILAFWGEVSPQDVAVLREVSPSSVVSALDTELFIMHDRSDPFIPYVESRRLRDATADNGHQVYFAEFDFLNHVELKSPSNPISFLADLVKLIFYSWLLMMRVL